MPRKERAQGVRTRRRIAKVIHDYTAEHGVAPSLTEITSAAGLASHNATRMHLDTLGARGIEHKPGHLCTICGSGTAHLHKVERQHGKLRTTRLVTIELGDVVVAS